MQASPSLLDDPARLAPLAAFLAGLAAAAAAWPLVAMATRSRDDRFRTETEKARRLDLRRRSIIYRWFEPLVEGLAGWLRSVAPNRVESLQHSLDLVEPAAGWRAEEFLAIRIVEGVPLFAMAGALAWWLFGEEFALPAGLLAFVGGPFLAARGVAGRANARMRRIRSRLPFAVDLIALMLGSGSIFRSCLEKAAVENRGHPLGEELERACVLIQRGRPESEALLALARRLDDPDVNEIVYAINLAEQAGGEKLKDALRSIADQVRIKQVLWLERAAEEAKVHITWPGFIIMIACLLIIIAPMVLQGMGRR